MPGPTHGASALLSARIERFLDGLTWTSGKIIVALSGGPDSAALTHALVNLPGRASSVSAVHVNHSLRGAASEADEQWVRSFCREIGSPLSVLDGTLDADEVRNLGVEAAARAVRYRLLSVERERLAADWVATAHTRSDQAETVMLRAITGRGTWRLSGILPVTPDQVIRPLLQVSRSEVLRYLAENGIEPRLDESNADSRFLRNRIRSELLPLVERWNPRIEEILADTASLELDRARAFEELLAPVRQIRVTEEGAASSIRLTPAISPHILRALLFEQIRRLDPLTREVDASTLSALVESETGEVRSLSPVLRAERMDDFIQLRRIGTRSPSASYSIQIQPGETVRIPEAGYQVTLDEASSTGALAGRDRRRQVIQVPFDSSARFEIRSRKPGDRFRPLGMDRDKNLADFLIDRRIPLEERDSLPLLVCNGSIAWVAGVEVGDEFKVDSTTGRLLEIVAERIGGRHERDHRRL